LLEFCRDHAQASKHNIHEIHRLASTPSDNCTGIGMVLAGARGRSQLEFAFLVHRCGCRSQFGVGCAPSFRNSVIPGRCRCRVLRCLESFRRTGRPYSTSSEWHPSAGTWFEATFGYAVAPLSSLENAVASWPEFATSVGVTLRDDDSIEVIAPYGLEDLFAMVVRRNPARVSIDTYRRRTEQKQYEKRWPGVTVVRC
jgi:hypothetical protein